MTDYDTFKAMLVKSGTRFEEECFTPQYKLISFEYQPGICGGGPRWIMATFTEDGTFGGFTSDD